MKLVADDPLSMSAAAASLSSNITWLDAPSDAADDVGTRGSTEKGS
jgi:hypothetical protein